MTTAPNHRLGIATLAIPPALTALSSGAAVAVLFVPNSELALGYLGTWVLTLLVCAAFSLLSIIQAIRRIAHSNSVIYPLAALLGPLCCLILFGTVAFVIYYLSLRYGE